MVAHTIQREPVCGLMPVRNAMPYLRQTLASIAAQDYRPFKLIAWDNGSTDGSAEELQRWVPQRIPGRIITDNPLPLGRCRAALIDLADCERCAWFDADDVYRPDRLSIQSRAMDKHRDAALIGGAMRIIDRYGEPTGETRRATMPDAELRWSLRFGNPIAQPTVMLRRSAVLAAGNYPDVPGEEDYEMWLRLSLRAPLVNLDYVLVDYRVHDSNITRRFDTDRAQHLRDRQDKLHDALFPGLGRADTRKLYDALCAHQLLDVKREDIARLTRAARCLADATGLPLDAIQATERYAAQRSNLRVRYIKRKAGLRHTWPILKRAQRLLQPTPPRHGGKEALDG